MTLEQIEAEARALDLPLTRTQLYQALYQLKGQSPMAPAPGSKPPPAPPSTQRLPRSIDPQTQQATLFIFCRDYIDKHGQGPSMAELEEETHMPKGSITSQLFLLRKKKILTWPPKDYRGMRVLSRAGGRKPTPAPPSAKMNGASHAAAAATPSPSGSSSFLEPLRKVKAQLHADFVDRKVAKEKEVARLLKDVQDDEKETNKKIAEVDKMIERLAT